jgi:hypothetical protein
MSIRPSIILMALCMATSAPAQTNQSLQTNPPPAPDLQREANWRIEAKAMGVYPDKMDEFLAAKARYQAEDEAISHDRLAGIISGREAGDRLASDREIFINAVQSIADPATFANCQMQSDPKYVFFRAKVGQELGLTPSQLAALDMAAWEYRHAVMGLAGERGRVLGQRRLEFIRRRNEQYEQALGGKDRYDRVAQYKDGLYYGLHGIGGLSEADVEWLYKTIQSAQSQVSVRCDDALGRFQDGKVRNVGEGCNLGEEQDRLDAALREHLGPDRFGKVRDSGMSRLSQPKYVEIMREQ